MEEYDEKYEAWKEEREKKFRKLKKFWRELCFWTYVVFLLACITSIIGAIFGWIRLAAYSFTVIYITIPGVVFHISHRFDDDPPSRLWRGGV